MQLWALGRAANPATLEAEGHHPYISSSNVQLAGKPIPPQPFTVDGKKHLYTSRIVLNSSPIIQKSTNTRNYTPAPPKMLSGQGLMV